jgi:Ca2+/H+ antiporter
MNYGNIFAVIFVIVGLCFHLGAVEQFGKITNPKTIRRMAIIFFFAAIVSALLGAETK